MKKKKKKKKIMEKKKKKQEKKEKCELVNKENSGQLQGKHKRKNEI